VEFALTVMLLVMFLFGIITFGWMFFLDNNMETAAREGARRMAVADASYAGSDVTCNNAQAGTVEGIACSMLPNWGSTITVNATCAGLNTASVVVSANGQDVALADIFGFFNGTTIEATVEMRIEDPEGCP
jgi:Flp pilus assembly protein TadG